MVKMVKKVLPFIFIIFICLVFFYPFFLNGLVPIPADFTLGVHYPWVDYKWPGYPTGVPVKNPLLADITSLTFPIKNYAIDLLKRGIFPLWNPLQFGGHPLIANFQSSVFYPLNLIYFVTDFVTGWTILIILQPILAAIFMYLLLKHLKISTFAAVAGGILYAFSGFNIIYLEYNNPGHVAALIPLLLLLVDKYLKRPSALVGSLFSISLAIQIFAGYPQVTVYTLILLGSWAIFRFWKKLRDKKNILTLIRLGFYTFLGFGVSAIQLIPGIELLMLSNRAFINLSDRFMSLSHLIILFAPDFFGNPATYNYWGGGSYIDTIGYSGLVTLIMATIAALDKKRSSVVKFFTYGSFFVILMALPNPISSLIHANLIPGSHLNRILILFNLFITILAAKGFDIFRLDLKNKFIYKALYCPAVLVLGLFILSFILAYIFPISNLNFRVGLRNLILPIILLLSSSVIFLLRNKCTYIVNILTGILIVMAVLELLRFGWKYEPFFNKNYLFPTTPILNYLTSQNGLFRISGGDVIPISMWIPYRLESIAGFDGMYPLNIAKLLAFMNSPSSNPNTTPMGEYGNLDRYDSPLLNLANIKYITALKYDQIKRVTVDGEIIEHFRKSNFKRVLDDRSVVVLENINSLPRAFFVTDWVISSSKEETLQLLNNDSFPLQKKIIFMQQPVNQTISEKNNSDVQYLNYSPNYSSMKVTTDHDGFLFISDTWYPGWKAKVDHIEVPILLADYAFRAIPVGTGNHEVEMYYDPKSFKIGGYVSIVTLVFLILSTFLLFKKREAAKENMGFHDL